MKRLRILLLVLVGVIAVVGATIAGRIVLTPSPPRSTPQPSVTSPLASAAAPAPSPTLSPTPSPTVTPSAGSLESLGLAVTRLVAQFGGTASLSLIELSGAGRSWSRNPHRSFVAASTYKLPLLMEEAELITSGRASPEDRLCYLLLDWEDGPFTDYQPGACYTRAELDRRVGIYSDNTAAHVLVRVDGGSDALNLYASKHGAVESAFYYPNTTTSADLARLWVDEASGKAGGAAAQAYLYPLLTHTQYEQGIPAGVEAGSTVVHKVGFIGGYVLDAALVTTAQRQRYVLAVCTEGSSSPWRLIAGLSGAVAQVEHV